MTCPRFDKIWKKQKAQILLDINIIHSSRLSRLFFTTYFSWQHLQQSLNSIITTWITKMLPSMSESASVRGIAKVSKQFGRLFTLYSSSEFLWAVQTRFLRSKVVQMEKKKWTKRFISLWNKQFVSMMYCLKTEQKYKIICMKCLQCDMLCE